jgi:hypothetical protein
MDKKDFVVVFLKFIGVDMKTIKLTQEKSTIVDDEDFERLSQMKWHALYNKNNESFYAHHSVYRKGKSPTVVRMHRYVLGNIDSRLKVDHKNGNTLDNRKENLRICNTVENGRNRTKKNKLNTSGYRGVSKVKNSTLKIWVAKLFINGKSKHVGSFETAEEAAKAFDKAAIENYGEFCGKLNFKETK